MPSYKMTSPINTIKTCYNDFKPDIIILYSDNQSIMEDISEKFPNTPLIIATNKPPLSKMLQRSGVYIRKTNFATPTGLEVLDHAEDIVLWFYSEGLIDSTDRVLLAIVSEIRSILFFEMENMGVISLKDRLGDHVNIEVLEAAFKIGSQIVKEGKEGIPCGALLILGDVNNVLNRTREMIRNPLAGVKKGDISIKNRENWNTMKEYSMMDGATIIDEKGYPIAAGRYVMYEGKEEYDLEEGLGGRHLAAAAITSKTRAVAIAVSSEGNIRIYHDGEKIYEYDNL